MSNYNKMVVTDHGISIRQYINDTYDDAVIITKEAFIEAYHRWIKEAEND